MCFKVNTPKAPEPTPAPKREDTVGATNDQRRLLASRQGTYGNIFTSVLGDSTYGQNTQRQQVAALGA